MARNTSKEELLTDHLMTENNPKLGKVWVVDVFSRSRSHAMDDEAII